VTEKAKDAEPVCTWRPWCPEYQTVLPPLPQER